MMAEGTRALPDVLQALDTGTPAERRAAAALLGWFPDRRSIGPILTALERSPGALIRNQLLFDLNMILLSSGSRPDEGQRNALAAEHLRWLHDQLVNAPIDSDIRSTVRAHNVIVVHPDRVTAPFSVELSTETRAGIREPNAGRASATAARAETSQAFLDRVGKDAVGVAFHEITAADGAARVATTLYLPQGRITNQVWISLYREQDGRWVPLGVPAHPVLHSMLNEPNLMPSINRDYGAQHPLKTLRLDLTMERIRVNVNARQYLDNENRDNPNSSGRIDESYVPLLERYKRSEIPSVRYTAEYETARFTTPDMSLWLDTLAREAGPPYQAMAREVIVRYATREIEMEGRDLSASEREDLAAAAVTSPEPIAPGLLPQPLPQRSNITRMRRSNRFGLVEVVLASGGFASGGYSMLFEHRGDRWVYLCMARSWIS
jgi:hypothetical protein